MLRGAQHPVEGADRGKVAAPHAEEGASRRFVGFGINDTVAAARPQPPSWRMQELFPRLRSGRMAERRVVVAPPHAVVAGGRVHPPPAGQLVGGAQFGEHDRVVPQRGAHHAIPAFDQDLDRARKPGRIQAHILGVPPFVQPAQLIDRYCADPMALGKAFGYDPIAKGHFGAVRSRRLRKFGGVRPRALRARRA
jgi:hypothetical protein